MEYHLLSDELLLKLLRVDDEGAFREVYDRYWKTLFNAARHKVKTDQEAEELVQDVLLGIWENRANQQIGNLGGYMFTALRYQVIDHYRSATLAEKYKDFILTRPTSEGQSPEELMDFSEIIGIFEQVLAQLPEKTAQIFRMSRIEFYSTREIAQKLNIPERTVEYHITQSLKQLRSQLRDYLPAMFLAFLSSF